MRISTLWYTFRQGFKNIFRNKVFSLATTATIASCIFLFGLFYCLVINVQYSVKAAQSGVAVTVFFDEGLGDDEIQQIGTQIQSREEVSEIKEEPPIMENKVEAVVEEATIPDFRIIGEAFKTYIFVELENKMLMIDKHAAHERILFEKFKSQQTSFQQMLLVPVTVTLSPDEYNAILENKELLYKAGYDIEDFGDRCVKVNACPTELVDEDIVSITMELASYLSMNGKTVMPEKLDWIYHSMACRAAIKAGNTTTDYELRKFVAELLSRDDIRYCPHGRPVMVEVSKRDLEKQFKRIV